MTQSRKLACSPKLILSAALALAAVALLAPAGAQAGPLVASAPDCDGQQLSEPFLPWLDPADYTMPHGGAFENGADGWRNGANAWTLRGTAAVVDGNESYDVHGSEDSHSLKLPAGSSAISSTVCVGLDHPTLRFFARRASGSNSAMSVEVMFEDAGGGVHAASIGSVTGTGSWQPTVPMPVAANLLPLLPGEYTPVKFRFTTLSGEFRIDDVYVDPRHSS